MKEIIKRNERNIRQALKDYGAHTREVAVLEDVSDEFIQRLAVDNAKAKSELRGLFSTSPVWDTELDALVINGTRTYDPDVYFIRDMAHKMLCPAYESGMISSYDLDVLSHFFALPETERNRATRAIELLDSIAPKAFAPTKKLSRVFRAVCAKLGLADTQAGSEFQRNFALFADELSTKKLDSNCLSVLIQDTF